jgi:hypothetical protein
MLLATIVLAAQVGSAAPARSEPARPCADPSLLCRISPYFCPGTYPAGLEPCWPSDVRPTRSLPNRPSAGSAERGAAAAKPGTAERGDVSRGVPRKAGTTER